MKILVFLLSAILFSNMLSTLQSFGEVNTPSPKKQVSLEIDPPAVKCKEGLYLVLKFSDNSPACVKLSTVDILYERGWGGAPPPCCKK